MRIYDTNQQRLVDVQLYQPGKLGLYVCGPTVYNRIHVGNARPLVVFDVLFRHAQQQGLEVTYVRNITDVDDRIIARAAEEATSPTEVAHTYEQLFWEDCLALNCQEPTVQPRATDHIQAMIAHVQKLIEKGLAYVAEGDVYFRVHALSTYGSLTKVSFEDLQATARTEPNERKEEPIDFALWKAAKPGEPFWPSPWGPGRPGWHIECSAMAETYLGPTFDIHGGGIDLRFPHHENEIAQSQGVHGPHSFARYWMHNGHVGFRWMHNGAVLGEGIKIAKSDVSMRKLLPFLLTHRCIERHGGEAVRLLLLSTQYRSPLAFDIDLAPQQEPTPEEVRYPGLEEADRKLEYAYTTLQRLYETVQPAAEPKTAVLPETYGWLPRLQQALDEDLNTPLALAEWNQALTWANRLLEPHGTPPATKEVRLRTLSRLLFDLQQAHQVLGLCEKDPSAWLTELRHRRAHRRQLDTNDVERRVALRTQARAQKQFSTSDALRQELLEMGVEVMDTPQGSRWRIID